MRTSSSLFIVLVAVLFTLSACGVETGRGQTVALSSGIVVQVPDNAVADDVELADRDGWATTLTVDGTPWEITSILASPAELADSGLDTSDVDGQLVYHGQTEGDGGANCVVVVPVRSDAAVLVSRPVQDQACPAADELARVVPFVVDETDTDVETSAMALAYGTQVGTFNGVIAYSNGTTGTVGASGTYGLKYQCVEYANRYYVLVYGHKNLKGTGNANTYFSTAAAKGLKAYANCGTTAPKVGDMITSTGGSYGHIAIIREVGTNYIKVIHQNWSNTTTDNSKTLTMTTTGGKYCVAAFSASYPVQGWMRK